MPDRTIRERCRRSPTLQHVSDAAERAWWRLTVAVDDYGCFEADPEILLAELMPRRPTGWTPAKMARVLQEWTLGEDPLVHLYRVDGDDRVYGHAVTFHKHQRERDSKPKYPEPPCAGMAQNSTLQQLAATCRESLQSAAYSDLTRSDPISELRTSRRRGGPPQTAASPPPLNGFATWPQEWEPIKAKIEALPWLMKHREWLSDLAWWRTLDEWLTSCPKPLDALLTDAVAYIESEGYVPRTRKAMLQKLRNCLHTAGRIAEREAQTGK